MAIVGGKNPNNPKDKPILSQKGDRVYREGEMDEGRTALREDGSVIGGTQRQANTVAEAMTVEHEDREHG